MREEYLGMECTICGAPADGLHYGALSCRSCNAFFRRAVTFDQFRQYQCRGDGTCDVTAQQRCGCRQCRFTKCLSAGMKVTAVQPRRDPTGSQRERRKRGPNGEDEEDDEGPSSASASGSVDNSPKKSRCHDSNEKDLPCSSNQLPKLSRTSPALALLTTSLPPGTIKGYTGPKDYPCLSTKEVQIGTLKLGYTDSTALQQAASTRFDHLQPVEQFERLIVFYQEHVSSMKLMMTNFEDFLGDADFRKMVPSDVEKLSNVELGGLLYWINKQTPYSELNPEDRGALLKRYSVRKLSLDHFYCASQHPDLMRVGNFAMLNNTFVPPGETGFELDEDDDNQKQAKLEIFAPTFERIWRCIIWPFHNMKITDAEIVFLHGMLMWSCLNNSHVSLPTKEIMGQRRLWYIEQLQEYYQDINLENWDCRLGEVILLLSELEVICDQHCQDFQVAKLFEFCDMSKYWYESLCYSAVNTNQLAAQYEHTSVEDIMRDDERWRKEKAKQMREAVPVEPSDQAAKQQETHTRQKQLLRNLEGDQPPQPQQQQKKRRRRKGKSHIVEDDEQPGSSSSGYDMEGSPTKQYFNRMPVVNTEDAPTEYARKEVIVGTHAGIFEEERGMSFEQMMAAVGAETVNMENPNEELVAANESRMVRVPIEDTAHQYEEVVGDIVRSFDEVELEELMRAYAVISDTNSGCFNELDVEDDMNPIEEVFDGNFVYVDEVGIEDLEDPMNAYEEVFDGNFVCSERVVIEDPMNAFEDVFDANFGFFAEMPNEPAFCMKNEPADSAFYEGNGLDGNGLDVNGLSTGLNGSVQNGHHYDCPPRGRTKPHNGFAPLRDSPIVNSGPDGTADPDYHNILHGLTHDLSLFDGGVKASREILHQEHQHLNAVQKTEPAQEEEEPEYNPPFFMDPNDLPPPGMLEDFEYDYANRNDIA